ncbi:MULTISPECIES: hypothetical protein [Chloracidobacterium]|jgi:hypothetical protein|uniref:hypothetical protein n=1 Tax=Chloracidobacterium TaxID=458032 RepID=UPI001B8D6094|nr:MULTISPECIES: hypothetical protein [Chloracidobacterium]QUV81551.1 hypothetical protein J8C01_10040 [Chloracidobacterium sp. D]QUV90463.1 hypothetical protein J8C04_09350 [Chloracidobacterium sp. A]
MEFGAAYIQRPWFGLTGYHLALPEQLIQYFVSDTSDSEWQVVGDKWFLYLVATGLLCTLGMLGVKFLRKQSAPNPQARNWSLGETVGFVCLGFIPLIVLCFIGWKFVVSNANIIGGYGLMVGMVFGILFYAFLMLLAHAVSPWRRDLYPRRR